MLIQQLVMSVSERHKFVMNQIMSCKVNLTLHHTDEHKLYQFTKRNSLDQNHNGVRFLTKKLLPARLWD